MAVVSTAARGSGRRAARRAGAGAEDEHGMLVAVTGRTGGRRARRAGDRHRIVAVEGGPGTLPHGFPLSRNAGFNI